ncbi:MAG: alpha/beta fold hydrolase [Thermoplasmata archaeon]|nr:alpha/beta fold hydrolase [Thermoplasmata archaeon]
MPEPSPAPIELTTLDQGNGTAILLLHGLGGDHTVFNGIVAGLARDHRVLAPDLRGHGRTPAPSGSTFSFAELEADVWELLDRRGIPSAHLVGLSAGGFLALQNALNRPERTLSLTLVAAGTHCDRHTVAVGERWAETLRTEGREAYLLRLAKDLYYPDWAEEHLDFIDAMRDGSSEDASRATVRWGLAVRTFDARPRMSQLRTPTLIIHGMDDQVVDVSHARLLRQSIAGTELRLLARTGHMVPVERPAETEEAIRAWITKIESGSTTR